MSAFVPLPDETLHGLIDQRLPLKAEREARRRLDADPQAAGRAATWKRQSDALRASFAPIAREPLPLSVLLKLQTMRPGLRLDPATLRGVGLFALGLACGLALGWLLFRGAGFAFFQLR